MKPHAFEGHNVIFAKDQPEYSPLPAHRDWQGIATTCWKLDFWERLGALIGGRVWIQVCTFHNPIQPLQVSIADPILQPTEAPNGHHR